MIGGGAIVGSKYVHSYKSVCVGHFMIMLTIP